MYKASEIADFFLKRHGRDGNITPMKLIKLVYIAHGWCLGLTGNVLIDENPEAWKYGPVIPSLYQEYKSYKSTAIPSTYDPSYTIGNSGIDNFLETIWEQYGRFSGTQLSAKTHMPGTPWSITWNELENKNKLSLQIPETYIRDHYKRLADINNG